MTNPNFTPGKGRLALDRYAAQRHFDGVEFHHKSSQININDPSSIYGNSTTVEGALIDITAFIASQSTVGEGFITVPDGYDTWHNADGNNNFDTTIPSLDTFLNPIFDKITNNQTLPLAYSRIQRGGIIVIKSGTYIVKNTINIPPGITLIGEGYGTKIINATSLTLTPLPPIVNTMTPTMAPVFASLVDSNRSNNDGAIGAGLSDPFIFSRATKIYNMVIADNFVEPTLLGEVNYKLPQNTADNPFSLPNNPLVIQAPGSNLYIDGVYFIGRVSTTYAVALDNASPGISTGTILNINNCFIDGFSQPISFFSSYGTADFLNITNSKIRSFASLSGDAIQTKNNTIILANVCNINISNNHLYGDNDNVKSALYLYTTPLYSTPILQNKCRISITNNNIIINKTSGSSDNGFLHLLYDNFTKNTFNSYATAQIITNNYGNEPINGLPTELDINPNGNVNINPIANNSIVTMAPTGASAQVAITPTGSNGSVLIEPVGTGGSIVIGTSGNGSFTRVGPFGNAAIFNVLADGTAPTMTVGTTGSGATTIFKSGVDMQITSGVSGTPGLANILTSGQIIGNSTNSETLRFGVNSIDLSSSTGTYALSSSEYNVQSIIFTGAPSLDVTVVFPSIVGYAKLIENKITPSSSFTVSVKAFSQTNPVIGIAPGQSFWVYCDGTNLIATNISRYMTISTEADLVYKLSETSTSTTVASSGATSESLSVNLPGSSSSIGMIGILDRCVYFAGGSSNRDYLSRDGYNGTTHTSSISTTYPFRMSIWIKPVSLTTSSTICGKLVDAQNASWTSPFYTVVMNLTSMSFVNCTIAASSGTTTTLITARTILLNEWNHIGMTYDSTSGTFNLYMNGVLEATNNSFSASTTLKNNTGPWFIGTTPNTASGSFNQAAVYMDDFRIESGGTVDVSADSWFADTYRMALGLHDDIGK